MFSRKQHKGTNHALSLIEILICIAILSLLLTIAIPVGYQALNNARGTTNAANHQQIAVALISYAHDHNGNLPWCTDNSSGSTRTVFTRMLTLGGYISDPTVFFSPWTDDWYMKDGLATVLSRPQNENINPWYYTNYGVNRYGAMPRQGDSSGASKPANLFVVASADATSRLMLTRDVYDKGMSSRGGGVAWFNSTGFLPEPVDRQGYDKIHASFADGHTKAYTREEYEELLRRDSREDPFYTNTFIR